MWKNVDPLLIRADYKGLLKQFRNQRSASATALTLMAMVFLGDFEAAKNIFEARRRKLDRRSLAISSFALLIGYVRKSEYTNAYLELERLKSVKKHAPFFYFQADSFLAFFEGKYAKSIELAIEAIRVAQSEEFNYGEAIARDIVSHSLFYIGRIEEGFHEIDKAIELAEIYGPSSLANAFKVSRTVYRSTYNLNVNDGLQEVTEVADSLPLQDTYSRTELLIKKSDLLLLAGRASQALDVLNEAFMMIYRYNHRRHATKINFKFAHLAWVRGQFAQSLHYLAVAKELLDKNVDLTFEVKILGLEGCVLKSLGQASDTDPQLIEKSKFSESFLCHRLLARQCGRRMKVGVGQDPLGDLFDHIKFDPLSVFNKVKEYGLWGALSIILPEPGAYLILGLSDRLTVIWDYGDIVCIPVGSSRLAQRILMALATGEKSKQELIEFVWGYDYDPIRHDSLVYQAIKGLRRFLGENLISNEMGGYKLSRTYRIISFDSKSSKTLATKKNDTIPNYRTLNPLIKQILNHRQVQFLKMSKKVFMSPQAYAKKFSISRITASRDLNDLLRQGLVQSAGRARALRYIRV